MDDPEKRCSFAGSIAFPCTAEQVAPLRSAAGAYSLGPGRFLFYAGQRPVGFYVLVRGGLRVIREGAGPRSLAGWIAPSAIVGMRDLLEGKPYDVSLQTERDCELIFVPVSAVRGQGAMGPGIRRWLEDFGFSDAEVPPPLEVGSAPDERRGA